MWNTKIRGVKFLELNAVSARLLELLQQQTLTGKNALLKIAQELNHTDPDVILNNGQHYLQQWFECGIVVGTRG